MLFSSVLRQPRLGGSRGGWSLQYPLQSLLIGYQCSCHDEHTSYGETGVPVPPFGCTFSSAPNMGHILAVANEEGFLRLYDTESHSNRKKCIKEWMAHWNAVFDLAWVPGEFKLVTAAGDQTAKFWDVSTGELMGTCRGHQCSLKSVAFSKCEKAVFCTGGRDGNIMVWDTRCNKKDGFYRQVNQISGAHNTLDKQTPSKPKKKQNSKGLAPSVDSQQSVTVVLFQDENTLVSAGAVDGVIKIWDLRKNYTAYRQEPIAAKTFPYPGSSTRKLGYSSLVLDSTGSTLFANCTDDNIYVFNMTGLKFSPVATYSGHQNSTFYIKSSLSPDDQFLISGSSDESAYIWKVSAPWLPPTVLQGHSQEVTSVCWCPTDFTKIATCSDDNTLKIWRLIRGLEERAIDKLTLVGWALQKKKEAQADLAPLTSGHSTPAMVSRARSSPILVSPSSAVCTPSCTGALPLPSITPTVLRTPPARRGSGSPKAATSFKLSIRQWMTPTLSPSPPATPPSAAAQALSPRKALLPVSLKSSQARSRAKRRLDSSCLDGTKQKCVMNCTCVTGLRSPAEELSMDMCCLDMGKDVRAPAKASRMEGAFTTATSVLAPPSPAIPCASEACAMMLPFSLGTEGSEVVGKENNSPENKNWLLAMAAKHKAEALSPRSPSAQTPSSRRLSGKTSPNPGTVTPGSMRKICSYFHRKPQADFCSPEQSMEL